MAEGDHESQEGMIQIFLFLALVFLLVGIGLIWYELATYYNVMNFFHFPVHTDGL